MDMFDPSLRCTQCGALFKDTTFLAAHLVRSGHLAPSRVMTYPETLHRCSVCQTLWRDLGAMRRHIVRDHKTRAA